MSHPSMRQARALVFPRPLHAQQRGWSCVNGLTQGCGISSANALEIPQSCVEPLTCSTWRTSHVGTMLAWRWSNMEPTVYTCTIWFRTYYVDSDMYHLVQNFLCWQWQDLKVGIRLTIITIKTRVVSIVQSAHHFDCSINKMAWIYGWYLIQTWRLTLYFLQDLTRNIEAQV